MKNLSASAITKMLSNLGGGAVKNGGQGIMGGIAKIYQMGVQAGFQTGFNAGVKAALNLVRSRL